jgi:hypothetical protein
MVSAFQASSYSWNGLVKELLSSPIVTNATQTASEQVNGEVVAVARRDHLCAAFNARLGFTDVCGLDLTKKTSLQSSVNQIVTGLPSDGYGRGAIAPILPNDPTLFFRAGSENICEAIAAQVIDPQTPTPGAKTWSSKDPDTAIADFVAIIMAITPSDPRSGPAQMLLKGHFTAAMQQSGITARQALESTFITACLAPSAVAIGL